MKKVILVTGASSGLGLATANALAAKGYTVYGTSRDIKRIKDVSFTPLQMYVTCDESVTAGVAKILKAEGQIDVVVNNAGNGITGPLYAMPVDAAKKQFEVNFFGVVRVCSAVLPGMIERKQGLVINIVTHWPVCLVYPTRACTAHQNLRLKDILKACAWNCKTPA